MEKLENPKLIGRERVREYRRTEEYEANKVGGDFTKHRFRAVYNVEEFIEEYEDPRTGLRFTKKAEKITLIPGKENLIDLGPVEGNEEKPRILKKAA